MSDDILVLLTDSTDRMLRANANDAMWTTVDAGNWPVALWAAIEAIGLPHLMVSEDSGGAGLSFAQAGQIIRQAAAHALPVPLAETIAAVWLLDLAGLEVPSGPLTLGVEEGGLVLQSETFSGTVNRVPWGRDCEFLVTVADGHVVLLRTADAAIERGANIAGEPRDQLRFSDAAVVKEGKIDIPANGLQRLGAAIRSLQIAGACGSCLGATIDYANVRTQFGKPIGKFQAVQHHVAVIAEEVAAATAAADLGSDAIMRDFDLFGVACAKVRSGEAAGKTAALSHQVFGAIGFTHEHMLHRLTRRLWAWRDEYGGEAIWSAALGQMVCAEGATGLWPALAAR